MLALGAAVAGAGETGTTGAAVAGPIIGTPQVPATATGRVTSTTAAGTGRNQVTVILPPTGSGITAGRKIKAKNQQNPPQLKLARQK